MNLYWAENNDINMQSFSWINNPVRSVLPFLDSPSRACPYFPRFLPLLYLAICIPTVLFLIMYRQPLGSPDEWSHVYRAYQISHGVLLTEEALPGSSPKGMVDEGLLKFKDELSKRRFESLKTALPILRNYGWTGTQTLTRYNSAVYFPAAFIPQAAGLKIAQELNLPLVQSIQLASMLNAAICLLIIALAIHFAAHAKFIIAFLGVLPMTVHQLASCSPDGILIAGLFLIFSLTITAVVRSEVRLSTLIGVVAFGALTAATKLPYIAMVLAVLSILWWIEARSGKRHLKYITACGAVIVIPLFWTKISNAGAVRHSLSVQTVPADQLTFIMSHPLEIPGIAFVTLSTHLPSYLVQIIGVLGWLDAPLPRAAYGMLGLGLVTTLVMDGISVKPLLRWMIFAGFITSVALIFLSLYLIWNPLYSLGPIEGVQGRYFLPILPFVVFLLPKLKHFNSDNLKLSIFTICGLVSGLATMATILKRYYS